MMKEMKNGIFTYNNESYEFRFKTSLSAYDKQVFVKTVINNLIDDDYYDVVIKDLIFDFAIIELFTNVDTSFIDNQKDDDGNKINPITVIEHFLEESDVLKIVKANMEDGLLEKLNRAVDLNIQYLTGINMNPINDAIVSLVSTLEKKVDGIDLDSMMEMAQKFTNMTEDLTAENVVNEYINSSFHQNKLKEIEEAKEEKV